jgi:LmbE family N-acetylglucosaminyl deacetylase
VQQSSPAEAEWLAILGNTPEWIPPGVPTLVIAPHPDDETLGAGGLIAFQRSRGVEVRVVAVTDGEKAYGDTPGLAEQREEEQAKALERLSVAREQITRLRLPDGNVASFEEELERRLSPVINRGTLVVTTWKGDRHPDHEACGRIAERLAKRAGATLCSYFFWIWHWGTTEQFRPLAARRFLLDAALLRAKSEALSCHRTQLQREGGEPVLPELLLQPARRPFEVFAVE